MLGVALAATCVTGCEHRLLVTPSASPSPYSQLPAGSIASPPATSEPCDTGWQLAGHGGVEWRQLCVPIGEYVEYLTIVRLDPRAVLFRVRYDPSNPAKISIWAERLEEPLLVVNGAYFTPENRTVGLLVSDGERYGSPLGDFAGMFVVTSEGRAEVRWLGEHPFDANEPLLQGVQSFPVLVKPGGLLGFPADADDGRPARRTIVAQDREGHVLFIVAPNGYFSLHHLACFLISADLGVDIALNLDGGTSTGLWLRSGPVPLAIDSFVPVPSVIVADYP